MVKHSDLRFGKFNR